MKTKKLKKDHAIEVFKKILDPELNIDIWTLGLIYNIELKEKNNIHVKMTFTSPMCPFGPALLENIKKSLKEIGFNNPELEVVFTPPWQPTKEVRMALGLT